jgi:type IV secretory pathway TraG/TraD family ATPase VirD4
MEFNDAALRIISLRDKCSRLAKQIPQPQVGALQTLLVQYESYLKAKGVRQEDDPVWAYFRGEYLAVANEKTAGSVAMVASNLTGLFVHPPFSDIFCADGNFNFNSVIDEGLIVYLDMPTAYYGPAATIAMLCLKIDFFRCMLSRPRLFQRDASGAYTDTLVNQVRPVIYFCDEFGSVITTGEETGEAGYLDKVREFRGSCLLGTQSISRLLTKVPETEIDSILTNTAIKIFLGNDDLKTNDYASKILGDRIRVNANLNQGAMEGFLSDKGKTGSRDFTTTSQKEAKFSGADFGRLQKGHAIVSLNKRFGKRRVQRLNFKGKPLAPPDTSPGWSVTPPALATT